MATIAANLLSISGSKDDLADNLVTMGVTANNTESLASLVGKVLDIEGGATLDGNAAVGDVLATKTFYNTDAATKETGTMTNVGAQTATISTVAGTVTPTQGYHNGSGSVSIHADEQAKLITGNIKSGVTVLGVSGDANVVDTSSGTAVAADLAVGKKAWVDGAEVTGTRGLDQYTVTLLHMDGADDGTTFTDETGKTWTAVGGAVTSIDAKAYGTASLLLDGTGDYISTPDHADFNFADYDFTVDFWVRFIGAPAAYDCFLSQYDNASNRVQFGTGLGGSGLHVFVLSGGTTICSEYCSYTWAENKWYHVAIVRNGSDILFFVNGLLLTTFGSADLAEQSFPSLSGVLSIGARYNGSSTIDRDVSGYIDEFRLSIGIARWTADFVPGAPYGG